MLVFVDESGDTGLKAGAGSSRFITLVLVIFGDAEAARLAEERITALRRELGKAENFEFHFKDNSHDLRTAFFQAVAPLPFTYTGFVLDKGQLYAAGAARNTVYADLCGLVFEEVREQLVEARVKIDRSGGQEFRRELVAYLKRKINDPQAAVKHIKRVDMPTSQGNNLLQLADMVCGAIARTYRADRREPMQYRKMIAHRETTVRRLPEQ